MERIKREIGSGCQVSVAMHTLSRGQPRLTCCKAAGQHELEQRTSRVRNSDSDQAEQMTKSLLLRTPLDKQLHQVMASASQMTSHLWALVTNLLATMAIRSSS